MSDQEMRMPFTGHTPEELANTLKAINECGLSVEAFDAFLGDYVVTKDLQKAWFFAVCEWDL